MRVGPAQLTGLDSAQKGWADLGPTVLSASLGLGRMWPRHEGWARKEKKKEGGGIIFPHPSSCIRSACKRNLYKKWSKSGGERRVTWHGGGGALLVWLLRWRCCSGGRWRCRGSRTTAPSSGAAVSSGEKRGYCYSPSPLVFHFSFSSFVVKWFPSLYSLLSCLFLSQTLPCFKLVSLPYLLSFSFPLVFFSSLLPSCAGVGWYL